MMRAQLVTPWATEGINPIDPTRPLFCRPKISQDYTLIKCDDVTAQDGSKTPCDPSLVIVEILCTDAVMVAIEADPNYANGILWSEVA